MNITGDWGFHASPLGMELGIVVRGPEDWIQRPNIGQPDKLNLLEEIDWKWDSRSDRPESSTYPNLHPLSSPSRYERSPSGLLVPRPRSASPSRPSGSSILWAGLNAPPITGTIRLTTTLSKALGLDTQYEVRPEPEPIKVDEPVIGYRAWTANEEGALRPLFRGGTWDVGQTKAKCILFNVVSGLLSKGQHVAPHWDCDCGLHVCHDLEYVLDVLPSYGGPRGMVVGAVVGWGRVIDHDGEGWRAEYARPIALLSGAGLRDALVDRPSTIFDYPVHLVGSPDLAARRHRVPLIHDARYLKSYAQEYGSSPKADTV